MKAGDHEGAHALYCDALCDGFSLSGAHEFNQWLERTRLQLHIDATDSARHLAEHYERSGDPLQALRWGYRALQLTPTDESMLRWLLERTARVRGLGAAVQLYADYERFMHIEFEVDLTDDTVNLMRRLSDGHRHPCGERPGHHRRLARRA